jgi:acyl carrier protein
VTVALTTEERRMAEAIVAALNIEHIQPESVDPAMPLFGQAAGSWGLDSIDALEIVLAIQQQYGVELKADDASVTRAFASLRALTQLVAERRVA